LRVNGNPSGPDVTVLFYNDFTVRANHSFKRGELNEKAIQSVVKDVAKITSK